MERGRGYLKGRRIFFVYTHGIQDHDLDGVGAGMWGGGAGGGGGREGGGWWGGEGCPLTLNPDYGVYFCLI